MHATSPRQTQQVRGHAVARQFTFHVPGPARHFHSQSGALAQTPHQPLRPLSRAQDVDSLAQEGLFHHPGISRAPAQQREGQNDEAGQRGAVAWQNPGVDENDGSQGHKPQHQQEPEYLVPLLPQIRRVVQVKPVGK